MDENTITALAREYANGFIRQNRSIVNNDAPIIHECSEYIIAQILRRYALVEKSEVKQFFQSRQNILVNQDKYDRYIVDEASVEKRLMLYLFPEIAKEVK